MAVVRSRRRACAAPAGRARRRRRRRTPIARAVQDRDTGRDSRADDAHEAVRPPRPRARAGPDAADAARPRGAGRAEDGARRRPPPDPLHLSQRHPRHRLSRLGAPARQTTSGSSTCRRSAASAASPAARRRRASSAATSPTRTSAAGSSRTSPTRCSTRTPPWTAPDGASRPAYRLESQRKDASAEFPRVVSLVLKDSFVVVARRRLQPPQREAEDLHGEAAAADRRASGRSWSRR